MKSDKNEVNLIFIFVDSWLNGLDRFDSGILFILLLVIL